VGNELHRAALRESELHAELLPYWRVSVVDVTGSTQDDCVARAENNQAKDGDVLVSNYQTAGRGRLDRTFVAPPSSALLFSIFLQPARTNWNWLSLLAGQSVARALSEGDKKLTLKWPNDLLVGEKKVGGIIATRAGGGVVIGIGINVGMTQEELPTEIATSLLLEGFTHLDRTELLNSILRSIELNLESWLANKDNDLLRDYSSRCSTLGKWVEITKPDGSTMTARATSIARSGELVLDNGHEVSVGDIVHLR